MFTDHSPSNYEQAIDVLAQAVLPKPSSSSPRP